MGDILGTSKKAEKGEAKGVLTAVVYLQPGGCLCPWASEGCRKACLGHSSGRLRLPDSARAREWKTELFLADRAEFLRRLKEEVARHARRAEKKGMVPALRLNGSADIPWERVVPELFAEFPTVRFYDYTKSKDRMAEFCVGALPRNYHLTYSVDEREDTKEAAEFFLKNGGTVAIVFSPTLPDAWCGFPVIDGDETDIRFADRPGTVVGLSAKGAAKNDVSGFVVRI